MSSQERTHPKPKHQVCELCCVRAYGVLSPIGTCEKCTEKLRKDHELQFLKRRVIALEEHLNKLVEKAYREAYTMGYVDHHAHPDNPQVGLRWAESDVKIVLDGG